MTVLLVIYYCYFQNRGLNHFGRRPRHTQGSEWLRLIPWDSTAREPPDTPVIANELDFLCLLGPGGFL